MDMKKSKVRKVGNSLGLTLPLEFIRSLNLQENDEVTLRVSGDSLIIERYDPEILAQMEAYSKELARFKHIFKALDRF